MYCKYCGGQIADDSRFCSHCGANLADSAPKVSQRIYQMPQEDFDDEPEYGYENEPPMEVKSTIEPAIKQKRKQPEIERHKTQHVKKPHVYGDFGADLSERYRERQADLRADAEARRSADPDKYARRSARRGRGRVVLTVIVVLIVIAWIIGKIKTLG